MIRFAICDDEIAVGTQLEQTLIEILTDLNVEHDIEVMTSPNELEKQLMNNTNYDFMFLDIEYLNATTNGVDLGKKIREQFENNRVTIVFISRESKYALELFQIQPLDFLIKPLKRERIEKVINKYLSLSGFWKKELTYKINRQTFKTPLSDIVYIESAGRKVFLHLADGSEVEFYGTLKELYKSQLHGCDFLFIHASYIVNYDYMTSLSFSHVKLAKNKIELPISKHRQQEVRAAYQKIFKRRTL